MPRRYWGDENPEAVFQFFIGAANMTPIAGATYVTVGGPDHLELADAANQGGEFFFRDHGQKRRPRDNQRMYLAPVWMAAATTAASTVRWKASVNVWEAAEAGAAVVTTAFADWTGTSVARVNGSLYQEPLLFLGEITDVSPPNYLQFVLRRDGAHAADTIGNIIRLVGVYGEIR